MSAQQSSACPLEGVDRRLDDAHRQWHEAEAAYFEPEDFRRAIQSAIQTLRTVTFILQNHKHDIPDFEEWYRSWRDKMRADPLMRWMIEARNRIEKQGDLEMFSLVRAELMASYLDEGPRIEVPAKLGDGVEVLLNSLPKGDALQHLIEHGTLRIERRWVENTLPDFELLDAVATAYGRLSQLVSDAHRQMGLERPTTLEGDTGEPFYGEREGKLPCMIGHGAIRALNIRLSDGARLVMRKNSNKVSRLDAERAAERFAVSGKEVFGKYGPSLEDMFRSLFDAAQKVFLKDGYHETIAFLFRSGKPCQVLGMRPEEHGEKYLMMRMLADEVQRQGADAVIVLAEAWSAPYDPQKPFQRAASSPEKREYLTAALVTKEEVVREKLCEILRPESGVSLGEVVEFDNPALFSFAPILQVWGSTLPLKWADELGQAAAQTDLGRSEG